MLKIAHIVEEILKQDDIALVSAQRGLLNLSSYARSITLQVETILVKSVEESSIISALSRIVDNLPKQKESKMDRIQSLAVHSNLEGMTYERSENISNQIRQIYHQTNVNNKPYLTVTQGINEVTIITEARVAQIFRDKLEGFEKIYDKKKLVGITVKFDLVHLEIPNLIFDLSRRLAYKSVNIVEIVSTATELTYIMEKKDLSLALEQLQKEI